MISNKKTLERVERLERAVKNLLQSFQIARYTEVPEQGVVDLPLFGIRFKFIDAPILGDEYYQTLQIPTEEFLDEEKIFVILCTKGYIRWLREQLGSHSFMTLLAYKDRWALLVAVAIEKAREEKKGEYLIRYFESLTERSFLDVYHEDPTIFDWIVV